MNLAPIPSQVGDPTWEIATYFPVQGSWTESEYLSLDSTRGVEFVEGRLEFKTMPTKLHQLIVGYLYRMLHAHVCGLKLGQVYLAGYRVKTTAKHYREPDLLVVLNEHDPAATRQYTSVADLAVEVVSDDDPARDLVTKRTEYAAAGIPEYWIVDPRDQTITVLTLPQGGHEYVEAGNYAAGQNAASVLLSGLQVDVTETFSQG